MRKNKPEHDMPMFREPSPQEQRAHAAEHLARVVVDTSPNRKKAIAKVKDRILDAVNRAETKS